MTFWLKDYAALLERIEYEKFKLTDPDLTTEEKEQTNQELKCCLDRKQQFEQLIQKFNSFEQKILYGRYVEGKTLEQIAVKTGYSYNYTKQKHAETMRLVRFSES